MTWIKELKTRYRVWNDNRKLMLIRKLILQVFAKELPGNVIRLKGREFVIEDIVLSLRKNEIKSKRTPLDKFSTRKQRGAIKWQIEQLKRKNEIV